MIDIELPVAVEAELLPGKIDPSTAARFANGTRAGQYAQMLADSGDYAAVYVEQDGIRYPIPAQVTR
jgi:hypothetical protein